MNRRSTTSSQWRRTRKPRRLRERFSSFAETTFCLGLLGWFLYGLYAYAHSSEHFRVRTIRVEGADVVPPETVIAGSGLTTADNVLFLRSSDVEARVDAIPFVANSRVKRYFPDKVGIAIEERVARATLLTNNRLFEIDRHGKVLRELEPGEINDNPFITEVPDLGYVEPGRQLTSVPLDAALEVWRVFSRTAMANDVTVSEISAATDGKIEMTCDELPFEIRWGRGDFEYQAWKLDVLWHAKNRHIDHKEYVDLRFDDDVVCR